MRNALVCLILGINKLGLREAKCGFSKAKLSASHPGLFATLLHIGLNGWAETEAAGGKKQWADHPKSPGESGLLPFHPKANCRHPGKDQTDVTQKK